MIDRQNIEQAIIVLQAQENILSKDVVETSLAALREQLVKLDQRQINVSDLNGARKQVTVMFADISGFTAMSEKLDPEEVRNMINLCFERLGAVVDRYDGHIDKFIGDEIMALFGAPVAHENDPERTLRAALDMMDTLGAFNKEYAHKMPKPLALHFGINSGLVIAGGIGTRKRQDYSVMGDTVNLASRLEGLSEAGEILVGESTYRLTAPLFEFESLPPVKVKGKEKPVKVYRLLQAKAIPGGQIRGVEGLFSEIVGRQVEMAELRQKYNDLTHDKGGAVSIIGEAGQGKSRLVAELQQVYDSASATAWAEGRALSHAENASYLLVRHILCSLLGVDLEASSADIDLALRQETNLLFPDAGPEIYPYLAYLLEIPLDEKSAQRVKYLEGELLRQQVWQAGKTYILTKAKQNPLVLILDDLHWADPSSLEVLEAMLSLTQEYPILLILMYRPHRDKRVWTFHEHIIQQLQDHHTCIELPALSRKDSNQLLNNLLGSCVLPAKVHNLILDKSEGNPFYLEEMIRSLLNSGALTMSVDGQDCFANTELDDLSIPDTLQGVIMSRVDRLPADIKRTLQVAAVLGRNFLTETLGQMLNGAVNLSEQLQYLIGQGLIAHKEDNQRDEYFFKHVFTQESVYQSLLRTDRRNLHQLAGETIEVQFQDELDEQVLLLAYHFEQSDDRDRAMRYLKSAATIAFDGFANQEAKELYSRLFTLLDRDDYANRWEILAAREQTVNRLGDRGQQATDLTVMQTLAELLGDSGRLAITHNRRAAYFDKISEYQAADEAAAAGLRIARRADNPRLEAQSLNSLALAAWRRFDYRQVQKWANEALEALKIVGAPTIRINSLLLLGRASYRLGQYDNALEYIQSAQEIAKDIDDLEDDAVTELIFGWIYQRLGDYNQAANHFQLVLEKRSLIGDRYGEATALSHLGWLAADQGLYDAGLDYCQQALDISQAITDRENESYALSGLALNHEFAGNLELAIDDYQQALAIHRDIGATTLAVFDQAGLARIALAQKDFEAAQTHISPVTAWILAGNAQQFWDPWTIYLSAYQVLTALGESDQAHSILDQAHTVLYQRAKEISDTALRQCFLKEVKVNREIVQAWEMAQP